MISFLRIDKNMHHSQGTDSVDNLTLLDLISLDELQQLQDTLAQMHQVASMITDPDGRLMTIPSNEISFCRLIRKSMTGSSPCGAVSQPIFSQIDPKELQACRICTRMGVLKEVVPVRVNDIHLADWWVCQYCGPQPSSELMRQCALYAGVSEETLTDAFKMLPKGDEKNFIKTIEWLKTLSHQLAKWVFENHVLSNNLNRLNHVERTLDEHRLRMEQEIEYRTAELIKTNNRLQLEVMQRDLAEERIKETEVAKASSERRLRLALESANEGLWDHCPITGYIYYSPRWFNMLGYLPGDFPDTLETWRTLAHPDELPFLDEALHNLNAGYGDAFNIEIRMLSKSGRWYWLQVRGRTVEFDDDGKATRIVGSLIDISKYKQVEVALQKANHELQRLAALDDLTQIANRRRFDDRLSQEWSRGRREKNNLAVILCDIDYFKDYNDTYGHLEGDETLFAVAQAISAALKRPTDLVARFGGEEFAMILPNTDIAGAQQVAEEVKEAVAALGIEHKTSKVDPCITLSFGGAAIMPSPDSVPRALMRTADQALYQAKSKGRNQISCVAME
jgi:diguanylate cyclase (GGDEF)-like protein/PAS domain S-box-containing protein